MADSDRSSRVSRKKPRIAPGVTLAFWRLRQTWRLLLVMGAGIVAAVAFVCTVPFYSDVTSTIGLRDVLSSSAQNSEIAVQSVSERLDAATITKATQQLQTIMQRDLGAYLSTTQFSIETQLFNLPGLPCPPGSSAAQVACDQLQLISIPTDQAIHHVTLAEGRLPQSRKDGIEIALTSESAARLKVHSGSILSITLTFFYQPPSYLNQPPQSVVFKIPLHVVGIFQPLSTTDTFWHGINYLSSSAQGQKLPWYAYTAMTSSDAYVSYISQLAVQSKLPAPNLTEAVTLSWYYNFAVSNIAIYNLNDIETGLYNISADTGNDALFHRAPFLEQTKIAVPTDALDQLNSSNTIVQVPTAILTLLVLGLVLFFVSMMSNLLVESQSGVIAILRSRGASRRQLFSSFVTQCVGLSIAALILGPVLAVITVSIIAPRFMPSAGEDIRTILFNEPGQVVIRAGLYTLITVIVVIATVAVSVGRSLSLDILSLRRESTRPTQRTLRERLNLDGIAVLIAVLGYLLSLYLTKTSVLSVINAQLNVSLLTPLQVAQVVFLFIAGILLFLRIFPALLHVGTRLATKRRSAAPVLAMTHMSRTPRQAVRLTLLLLLSTIFTIFSTSFVATQTQRIADVAAYQVGADFSGIPAETSNDPSDLPRVTQDYRHIPGVLSASLGYSTTYSDLLGNTMDVRAVDADTFAQTAIWNQQDSSQPLSSLMAHLAALRGSAAASAVIPVYVDAAGWQAFGLSNGSALTLDVDSNNDTLNFVAIGEVQHIPTINDTSNPAGVTDPTLLSGGMLVDYQALSGIYINLLFANAQADNPYLTFAQFEKKTSLLPFNYAWLRTSDTPVAIASVRKALNGEVKHLPGFSTIFDRRAMMIDLQGDPLYLNFVGILIIGAITTMLLALIGTLVASWLSTRGRLTNFVVLRALGATSQQVATILTWEQCITYATSLILGSVIGIVFSRLVLPYLVYTGVAGGTISDSATQYYLVQNVPPVQIIIPSSSGLIIASLVAICAVGLGVMVMTASRPSLNQTLRLNED